MYHLHSLRETPATRPSRIAKNPIYSTYRSYLGFPSTPFSAFGVDAPEGRKTDSVSVPPDCNSKLSIPRVVEASGPGMSITHTSVPRRNRNLVAWTGLALAKGLYVSDSSRREPRYWRQPVPRVDTSPNGRVRVRASLTDAAPHTGYIPPVPGSDPLRERISAGPGLGVGSTPRERRSAIRREPTGMVRSTAIQRRARR